MAGMFGNQVGQRYNLIGVTFRLANFTASKAVLESELNWTLMSPFQRLEQTSLGTIQENGIIWWPAQKWVTKSFSEIKIGDWLTLKLER